ncbi:putative integral membrane protein [Sulfuricella denitrificans skB26]|uniref:Putative integral membrane protein n=1 Tax=Sulfuricella denitrificans (strain DSM 22764 / NBRC 105220 / skB26) TaxID=1163617 RepID=S6AMJ8_SULDS|nr:energy-coupling factor ABC transporter permease [Sulfuricella denitrificans]BAN36034.1 putative integral membrane protein [Sulfuricella denitrificans skB26]
MNLPDNLLPSGWYWTGQGLYALILLWAILTAPWRKLRDASPLNVWLGACVLLMALWSVKTGIKPGLNFHLLGTTAMTLMFGPRLALIGLSIVLTAVTLAGMSGWQGYGWNGLIMGALPVAVSYGIYWLADRKLPNHLFVYIFLNAFFGGALAMAAAGLGGTLLLQLSGAYPPAYLYHDYLPYFILIAWSEAVTTGMAITLMAVYSPLWLSTFDDARYLRRK